MKSTAHTRKTGFLAAALLLAATAFAVAQTNNIIYGVSTPGAQFAFEVTNVPNNTVVGTSDPSLILTAGATYRFIINTTAGFHPVVIATNTTSSPPLAAAYSGASPQNITTGVITVTIPRTNFPSTLFYQCNIHLFSGPISILPPPPPNKILSESVATNVMMVSTGTNMTWVLTPQFNSNLVSGAWAPVPNFNNSFSNGTNVTTFGRLEAICGPNVFLRLAIAPPPAN